MIKQPQASLFDLVMCLSEAVDLVDITLAGHHKKVAYIGSCLGAEMKLPFARQNNLVLAGALHDIGALSLSDRMNTLRFDFQDAQNVHAELGARLLATFQPFVKLLPIVRYHHIYWRKDRGDIYKDHAVPIESHILHLADRISVSIDSNREILEQTDDIAKKIKAESGRMFHPEIVDAFMTLVDKEYFWIEMCSPAISSILTQTQKGHSLSLDLGQLEELALLFSKLIDFRSAFTATHSAGVAVVAEALSKLAGFSDQESHYMRIAGYLHDLGKLAISKEILEKPAKLDQGELNRMKYHAYYTYRILNSIDDFQTIAAWSAFHHERVDGKGYPFHHSRYNLPIGARIMSIADVFTAISEDRPYRSGMDAASIKEVLTSLSGSSLDADLVGLCIKNFDGLYDIRRQTQVELLRQYDQIVPE